MLSSMVAKLAYSSSCFCLSRVRSARAFSCCSSAAGHQLEVDSGTLGGDEPPCRYPLRLAVGFDAASTHQELALPLELDPQISDRLGIFSSAEHPRFEDPALLTRRVDSALSGGQQKRQEHIHSSRLAGTVDPSQQQSAPGEVEHLVLVLVDVDDSRTIEPPPLTGGTTRIWGRSQL